MTDLIRDPIWDNPDAIPRFPLRGRDQFLVVRRHPSGKVVDPREYSYLNAQDHEVLQYAAPDWKRENRRLDQLEYFLLQQGITPAGCPDMTVRQIIDFIKGIRNREQATNGQSKNNEKAKAEEIALEGWETNTVAAKKYIKALKKYHDHDMKLNTAKKAITQACDSEKIKSSGKVKTRRIDPVSLQLWIDQQIKNWRGGDHDDDSELDDYLD